MFLHGAGPDGPVRWPRQSAVPGAVFSSRPAEQPWDDPARDAAHLLALLGEAGGHLVAHSYGGLAAVLAARGDPGRVRSLLLIEPACVSLARGVPAVEEHVAEMSPVMARAHDSEVDDLAFGRGIVEVLGIPMGDDPEATRDLGARFRHTPNVWEVDLGDAPLPVPTLVVTGGWSPLYDGVAAALRDLGAQWSTVPGNEHRPHDLPAFDALLDEWLAPSA